MRSQRVEPDPVTFAFSSCAEGQGKRTGLKMWTPLRKPSAQTGARKSWSDGTAKDNAPVPNLEAQIHRRWGRWLRNISPEKEQIFWHFRPRYWFVVVANKRGWFRYLGIQISFPAHAGSTNILNNRGKMKSHCREPVTHSGRKEFAHFSFTIFSFTVQTVQIT